MNGFAVYYVESNLVCVLVFGILLVHNHFNMDRQEKQIKYDHVLTAFILYFMADCVWAEIVAQIIPKTRFSVVLDTFLLYILMAAITYFWLEYVMAYEQVPHRNRPINRFAVLFPFIVSTIALVLNYIFDPKVLINESHDVLPAFSIYLITVPCIYLVAVIFYTIRRARRAESHREKRKHLFVGFFPVMSLVGGLIQVLFFPYIPIYCFTCMFLMLLFYIQSIELRISLDPLTQLNNRGQLTRYISMKSNLHQDGKLTIVVMMDIDGFKAINDTYGHAEGDKALVIVSDALKKAVNSHNMPSFLGRYGGDEFILILHPVSMKMVDDILLEIRENIEHAVRETPYPLSISFGCAELESGQYDIQDCIERADANLYQDKKQRGTRRTRLSILRG